MENLNLQAAFITSTLLLALPLSRAYSVTMTWNSTEGYYPFPANSSVNCSQDHYIEIINIYGRSNWGSNVNVTLSERFLIKQTCNCKRSCQVPVLQVPEMKKTKHKLPGHQFKVEVDSWELNVEYTCIAEAAAQYTNYIGCFKDKDSRDLDHMMEPNKNNTPQNCIKTCSSAAYLFAGVQFSEQCFCGHSYGRYRALSQSYCDFTCTGDISQKCGGRWANGIYRTDIVAPCSITTTTVMTASGVSSQNTPSTTTGTTTTTSSTTGGSSTDLSMVNSSGGISQIDNVSSLATPRDMNQSTFNTTQLSKIVTPEDESTLITAVVVSTFILVIAVPVFLFLYRRWRRKNMTDATYKDGPHVTNKNKDGELTNITYSKDTGNVKLQDSRLRQVDTYSNSGDSGYTDMHNEDSREAENDYYMIKEDRKSNTDEIVDDQYYTIKDNVSSDYNKIAFKPEVIPDDQNYGHTLRPGKKNVMDRTYDHAGSSGTLLHAPSREDVNEYSHLNERKPKINHKEMANAVFNQNQLTSKTNELGDVALTGHDYFVLEHSENEPPENSKEVASHDYFVLEKSQSQLNDQETTAGTDAESHDYFVLSKEESIGDTNGNNSVPKLRDCKADFKHDTRGETHNDVNDHTYFENPFLTELEDDIHQYQAMDQRISNIEPENTNHDYFILEKEKA